MYFSQIVQPESKEKINNPGEWAMRRGQAEKQSGARTSTDPVSSSE
jgi:hypothetical protein